MTATQAPTPGPLSGDDVNPECDTGGGRIVSIAGRSRFPRSRREGSRFTGRLKAMPFLHERGASAHNVPSRIGVGVIAMITGDALEDRLALTASGVNDTTFGARLRRVGGGDVNQPPAGGFQLVLQLAGKDAPALRQNGTVQTSLLRNPPARLLDGSPRTRRHSADVQLLQHDQSEPTGNASAGDVQMMRPHSRDLGGQPGDGLALLRVPSRATLTSCECSLRTPPPLLQSGEIGEANVLSVRQGKRGCDASVNADSALAAKGSSGHVGREDHLPALIGDLNGDIHHLATEAPGASIFHPTNTWKSNLGPLRVQITPRQILPRQANALMNPLPSEVGIAAAAEEAGECLVEITQRVFQTGARHCAYKIELPSKVSHLERLLPPRNGLAGRGPILAPKVPPLLQGEIVNEPCDANPLTQNVSLTYGWIKAEAEAAVHDVKFSRSLESDQ